MMTLSPCPSMLKQITPHLFPSSKNIAVHGLQGGFENSFLGDSIDTVMDVGHDTPRKELRSRIRSGDNFEGPYFLAYLENLRRKKESQKLHANTVNPLALSQFTDYNIVA